MVCPEANAEGARARESRQGSPNAGGIGCCRGSPAGVVETHECAGTRRASNRTDDVSGARSMHSRISSRRASPRVERTFIASRRRNSATSPGGMPTRYRAACEVWGHASLRPSRTRGPSRRTKPVYSNSSASVHAKCRGVRDERRHLRRFSTVSSSSLVDAGVLRSNQLRNRFKMSLGRKSSSRAPRAGLSNHLVLPRCRTVRYACLVMDALSEVRSTRGERVSPNVVTNRAMTPSSFLQRHEVVIGVLCDERQSFDLFCAPARESTDSRTIIPSHLRPPEFGGAEASLSGHCAGFPWQSPTTRTRPALRGCRAVGGCCPIKRHPEKRRQGSCGNGVAPSAWTFSPGRGSPPARAIGQRRKSSRAEKDLARRRG